MDIRGTLLRDKPNDEQLQLINAIYRPFADNGEWPLWSYVDFVLDQQDIDAAEVLRTLPQIRHPDPVQHQIRYALTWHDSGLSQPNHNNTIGLTAAGLRHVPDADPLLRTFVAAIAHIDTQIRGLTPSPYEEIRATLPPEGLAEALLTASIDDAAAPPVEITLRKLRELLRREPTLGSMVNGDGSIHVGWATISAVRALRGIADADEYLDRVAARVCPDMPAPAPAISWSPLDLPNAIGYLDAVWRVAFKAHLFVDLDPASVARLTQPCCHEGDFNSLMSALADVLSRAAPPGVPHPPERAQLEAVRRDMEGRLQPPAVDRIRDSLNTLIKLRQIRNSSQHSDARHKAVTRFAEVGLTFPPYDWPATWMQVVVVAKGALDAIREEVNAAFGSTS